MSVCFCPYGKQVASGSSDNSIKIWDTNTGDCESTLTVNNGVNSVAFSPDGSKIAAANFTDIQIFDTQTQAKVGSPFFSGHSEW